MFKTDHTTKYRLLEKKSTSSKFKFWQYMITDGIHILGKIIGGALGGALGGAFGSLFGLAGSSIGSFVGLMIGLSCSAVIEQHLPKFLLPRISKRAKDPSLDLSMRGRQLLQEAQNRYDLQKREEDQRRENPVVEDIVRYAGYDSVKCRYIFKLNDGGKAYVSGSLLTLEPGVSLAIEERYVLRRIRGSSRGRVSSL